jgi:hypothetical protein
MGRRPKPFTRAGTKTKEPKLHAGEDHRARAVGLDDLTSWRQHPVCLVDPERHNRVGVLLIAEALVGIGGVEDLGRGIEGKKARGLCVVQCPAGRSQGPVSRIGGEYSDAVVAAGRGVDDATDGATAISAPCCRRCSSPEWMARPVSAASCPAADRSGKW